MPDLMERLMGRPSTPSNGGLDEYLVSAARARPIDICFVIDQLHRGAIADPSLPIDLDRIGMMGHSFGGWTTLATIPDEPRIAAALPLAPAGGRNGLTDERLFQAIEFKWRRNVPTLFIVADLRRRAICNASRCPVTDSLKAS